MSRARAIARHAARAARRLVRPRSPQPTPHRLGYLCNQYPAISHTFILREVRELRRLGVDVETVTIRRSDPGHLLAAEDREEFAATFAILPVHPIVLLRTHVGCFVAGPGRYLRTLRLALSLARPGWRGRLWQLFYLAEAGIAWAHCRRRGVRHVHAQFTTPAADVALLLSALGGPEWSWSFAAHGTDIFDADQRALAEKVRRARFVTCVSDFGRSQLMVLVDERHWAKIRVVPCGVDVERFTPVGTGTSRRRDALNVLVVGRLVAVKAHSVLLNAIAELRNTHGVTACLHIVGDGPRREHLERATRGLGLADQVTFHGRVGQDDLRRHYAAADVFCLPSVAEGVPVVLMEAMAMEIPVVACAVMGIPELIEDGKSGLLVRPGRADALAEALARLSASPQLRLDLARAARARVEAAFTIERSARTLRGVYMTERVIAVIDEAAPVAL